MILILSWTGWFSVSACAVVAGGRALLLLLFRPGGRRKGRLCGVCVLVLWCHGGRRALLATVFFESRGGMSIWQCIVRAQNVFVPWR